MSNTEHTLPGRIELQRAGKRTVGAVTSPAHRLVVASGIVLVIAGATVLSGVIAGMAGIWGTTAILIGTTVAALRRWYR